jgi:hypothetical protein
MEGVESYKVGIESILSTIKSPRERQKILVSTIKNEWNSIRLAGLYDLFTDKEENVENVLEVVYLLARFEFLLNKLD